MTQRILEKGDQQLAAGLYPGASLSLYRDGLVEFLSGLGEPANQSATQAVWFMIWPVLVRWLAWNLGGISASEWRLRYPMHLCGDIIQLS